jgi:hypothetical protein
MTEQSSELTPLELRAAELERRLEELEASSTARLVRAEMKAEAVRAGMIDLDGLKLLDMAGLTVTPQGDVPGAEGLMAQLRRSKPWMFGAASSSSPAPVPPAQPPTPKSVAKMSYAEWQSARTEMLRRR